MADKMTMEEWLRLDSKGLQKKMYEIQRQDNITYMFFFGFIFFVSAAFFVVVLGYHWTCFSG